MKPATSIDLDELDVNPFPVYARLRVEQPWAWSEDLGMWLVSRYSDVVHVDQHPEIFSSEVEDALTTRAMGLSMLRTEGASHLRLRSAAEPPLKRRSVRSRWTPLLERFADDHVAHIANLGSFDMVADFASPFTGACLAELLGLRDATADMIRAWSNAFIAGATNSRDDPDVWRTAAQARDEVQAHVAAAVKEAGAESRPDVISALSQAHVTPALSLEEIASNVRLMIAGGFNDARDVIATLAWVLLTQPDTHSRVVAQPDLLDRAVEECVRWLSPVGTYPRQLLTDYRADDDVILRSGDKLLVLAASANWDESRFPDPEKFDLDRPNLHEHVGFSLGMHYCLGSQFVREMARVAVPRVTSLPGVQPQGEPEFLGWMFRGPITMPIGRDSQSGHGVLASSERTS